MTLHGQSVVWIFTQKVMGRWWGFVRTLLDFRKLILGAMDQLDWRDDGEENRQKNRDQWEGCCREQGETWVMLGRGSHASMEKWKRSLSIKQKWWCVVCGEKMASFIYTLKTRSNCDFSTSKAVHILCFQITNNPIQNNHQCYNRASLPLRNIESSWVDGFLGFTA